MANKETRIFTTDTLETLRQKTNEVSLHLGDNEQFSASLSDKTFNYDNVSAGETLFSGIDGLSKTQQFNIKTEQTLDNTGGYIILTGSPTITGFVAGATLTQSGGYSAAIVSASTDKILVKNSSGTFSSSSNLVVGSNSIASSAVVRIIAEAFNIGVVRVYVNSTEITQDLEAGGFHVPNYSANIPLLNSPTVTAFTEGSTVYQGSSLSAAAFSGTVLSASATELKLKNHTGSFSASAVIKIDGSGSTITGANHSELTFINTTIGNAIVLNTPAALNDDIKVHSPSLVDAVNELQDDVGITENLTTVATNLVGSVNEIEAVFDASTHEISAGSTAFNVTSGEFTIDSSADIVLDADGGNVELKDNGTQYGSLTNAAGNVIVKSGTTTMLTGAGASATFAEDVTVTRDADVDRNLNVDGTTELNSTLGVDGNFRVGTNKFNVTAATGNTQIDGTLEVDGTAGIDGDLRVGTNKFNVAASSGNTQIDGTLEVDGTAGVDGNFRVGSSGGDKFNVTASSGNTQIDGTLNVDSTTTLNGTTIDGGLDLNGSVDVSTNATIHGVLDVDGVSNLDVVDIDGAVDMALTLQVDGNTTIGGVVDIGQLNAKFTNRNNVKLALNELHDEMGNAAIAGTGTAAAGLTNLTAAINSIDAEIGTVASYEGGTYGSTTISGVLTSLQTGMINNDTDITNLFADVGTLSLIDNLPTDYTYTVTDLTTATNTMSGFIGNTSIANIGTTDTVTGALDQLHAEIGDSVLTVFSAPNRNISAALRELEAEKVYLSSTSQQEIVSKLGITGDVTFKNDGSNADTMTFNSGTTLDLSNASLLLPGNASNVNIFSTSFLEVDGNAPIQGFSVDRQHVTTITDKADVRLQWNENHADGTSTTKPARSWQFVGLNDVAASHTTDIVTFYNAKELITSNTESGINVTWDATNENFDFNVNDPTLTFTGDVTGTGTITNLDDLSVALTIQPNSVALTTDTTGDYVGTVTGTANQITVSGTGTEGRAATLSIPTDFRTSGTVKVLGDDASSSTTTGALTVAGGVGIGEDLYVAGDLYVQGDTVQLNTSTLTVEDTLVLAGNNLSTEPSSGGFGLEVGPITSPSGLAAGVTGAHSIVYNYATDRWEADGSLVLSETTLTNPGIEVNGTDLGTLTGAKTLDLKAGTGIGLAGVVNGNDFEVTISNTLDGYSGWFLSAQGVNKGNIADDERVDFFGGTALSAVHTTTNTNRITFNHDNVGPGAQTFGQAGTEDGTYIKSVTINAQGHVTGMTEDDFDNRYDNYGSWQMFLNGTSTDSITSGERFGFDAGAAITLSYDNNDLTINHADTSSVGNLSENHSGNTFIQDLAFTFDTFGHVTGATATEATVSIGDGTTTAQVPASATTTTHASGIVLTGDTDWSANQTGASSFQIAHANTSNQVSVDNTGNNVIQDITLDTFGHITSLVSKDITTVTNAAKLYTTATNSVGPYYLSMAGAYGNAYQDHYTDANLSYNASTNVLSAVTFSGALSGNASSASTSTRVTSTYTNAGTTMYINGTAGLGTDSKAMHHTNAIYMTPSNDYLYAARFVGPVTGAVTGNASTSTQVYVTSTATSASYRLIFGEANDGANGYESLYKDSGASLYYNPSTNRLYAEHIQGEGSLITNINYGNISNPPTIPTVGNGQIDGRTSGLGLSGTMDATANQSGNTTFTVTSNAVTAATANTLAYRDAGGHLYANHINTTSSVATTIQYISGMQSNNFQYKYSAASIRAFLNVENGSTADQTSVSGSSGSCTGNAATATNATKITSTYSNANATFYITGNTGLGTASKNIYHTNGIYFNGSSNNLYAAGDVVAAASDDRLKDKKGNIENALDKVNALNGFNFSWNDKSVEIGFRTAEQQEENHIGLSAQEVKAVAPELTTESAAEGYDTVRYDKVTALLVEAIKELTQENKSIRAELEILKSINT